MIVSIIKVPIRASIRNLWFCKGFGFGVKIWDSRLEAGVGVRVAPDLDSVGSFRLREVSSLQKLDYGTLNKNYRALENSILSAYKGTLKNRRSIVFV